MFWIRNKENSFPICTIIWRPDKQTRVDELVTGRKTVNVTGIKIWLDLRICLPLFVMFNSTLLVTIHTALVNSMESDLGCSLRVFFDKVTLMSQKPCQHNF